MSPIKDVKFTLRPRRIAWRGILGTILCLWASRSCLDAYHRAALPIGRPPHEKPEEPRPSR